MWWRGRILADRFPLCFSCYFFSLVPLFSIHSKAFFHYQYLSYAIILCSLQMKRPIKMTWWEKAEQKSTRSVFVFQCEWVNSIRLDVSMIVYRHVYLATEFYYLVLFWVYWGKWTSQGKKKNKKKPSHPLERLLIKEKIRSLFSAEGPAFVYSAAL